ncbi:MAG: diguanylate cyclase [Deltaproteobacteria bacterium]|nr:diguanylate cyclase [Deltaproteobacteria bacterium]
MTPQSHRILIVEDDPIVRRVYRATLGRAGYDVLEAIDARTGYSIVCDSPLDLILLDLRLPDESGAELGARIHADPDLEGIPLIAVSGVSSTIEQTHALQSAFREFLLKPVSPARLLEVVRSYLPQEGDSGLPGKQRAVIVAHHDELQRGTMALRFRRQGFAVQEVKTGVEALELALKDPPAAVLSGVPMPHLDGFGLARAMRGEASLRDVPLVLVSPDALETRDVDAALRAGAAAYVQSDVSMEAALTTVHRLLDAASSGTSQEVAPLTDQEIFGGADGFIESTDALRETMPSMRLDERTDQASMPRVVDARSRSRLLQQLERQAQITKELTRITNRQAAQLSVLAGVSETLTRTRDPQAAIEEALARCMDVSVFSLGAAFLVSDGGRLSLASRHGFSESRRGRLPDLFGYRHLLHQALHEDEIITLPSSREDLRDGPGLLEATGTHAIQLVPLSVGGQRLGVLVLASPDRSLRRRGFAFARTIQGQLAQALLLGHTMDQLAISEQRFRRVTERMAEGLFTSNRDEKITFLNDAARRLFGLPMRAAISLDLESLLPGIDLDAAVWEGTALAHDGARPTVRVSTSVHATGAELERTHIVQDVTDARRQEEHLRVLAERDPLTGLLNRRSFLAGVEEALTASAETGAIGAVLFIDLDGFKAVNDNHGHAAGDYVLEKLADALSTRLRRTDLVGRIGGDEFAVLQPGADEQAALALGHQILRIVQGLRPRVGKKRVSIGASVGCVVFPRDGATDELLLERADAAMYAAKNAGGHEVVMWRAESVEPRMLPKDEWDPESGGVSELDEPDLDPTLD